MKAYKVASETASKNSDDIKSRYDQKVKENRLEVGDTVLVRKVHHTGESKLADIWETDPYIITDVPNPEIPVYRVRTVLDKGPVRILHRNLLLPFNSIPPVHEAFIHDRPRLTRKGPSKKVASVAQSSGSNNSDTDSESSQRYVIPQRRTRQQPRSPRHTMQSSHERSAMTDQSQSEYTDQHSKGESSVLRHSDGANFQTSFSAYDHQAANTLPPVVQPDPVRRSAKERRAPDRYGQQACSQTAYYVKETVILMHFQESFKCFFFIEVC